VFLLRNYETKQGKRKDIVSLEVALKRYCIPYARPSGPNCHFGNGTPYARTSAKRDFLHEA
jgi:hypothetical protein